MTIIVDQDRSPALQVIIGRSHFKTAKQAMLHIFWLGYSRGNGICLIDFYHHGRRMTMIDQRISIRKTLCRNQFFGIQSPTGLPEYNMPLSGNLS